MSRYAPINTEPDTPPHPTHSRRSSLHSLQSIRMHSTRRPTAVPDPGEMDAAFDGPPDFEEEGETHGLLGREQERRDRAPGPIPGDYDFERDYTLPPSSPPPFQPYSAQNPAPGNSNGIISTAPPYRPNHNPPRHFLGGILPSSFLPRHASPTPGSRVIGGGTSGVFGNLAARPDGQHAGPDGDGPEYVPEDEQKDGPPSYQAALRDAVPPYWDTTVVLPSSSSPFGPLSSSISGDEILIDGMPSGNFFGFFWNLIVSVSFQFVGFLLTYVLHTTHAAKYGSRVGLGLTMIQLGLGLRSRAEKMIEDNRFPSEVATDPSDPVPPAMSEEEQAENAIEAIYGPGGSPWPQTFRDPNHLDTDPGTTIHNIHEAEIWANQHNITLSRYLGLPTAEEVGRANEYFSFMMMSIGWFIVLTSFGGWWRVKRFERGLRRAQRESEEAQAQAAANRANGEEGDAGETITTAPTNARADEPGLTSLTYYTSAFREAFDGARHIQRGFFGMHGRPLRGGGHAPLSTEDDGEHELLDAQGFGLGPMATMTSPGDGPPGAEVRRQRGLWS
ncbi:hypothetical protein CI109_100691 [Kwoniella shandongensis]|uniref:Uncharacterized protein n=1 Tax=Kwoniella shandongensis TaxID=1734106 RepID=A0A5M6C0M8_9TREE|nr:uncharacterized protein CI109_003388 [Kwoniella shandongensis]KAA5528100.1 hypothetical protein CI109_003388 [Kwoniella shandongensis]